MSLLSDITGVDPFDLWDRRTAILEENVVRPVFNFLNPGQLDVVDEYYDRIADAEEDFNGEDLDEEEEE